MSKFRFTVLDSTGAQRSGSVDAASRDEAAAMLEGKGLQIVDLAEALAAKSGPVRKAATPPSRGRSAPAGGGGSPRKGSLNFNLRLGGGVKQKDLVQVTRQLSTLINAGLPLVRSIQVLQKQEKNPVMREALDQMEESISSGSTFAEALAAHPKIFDRLYVNMVKAGELGGVLDKVLKSLSEFMEKMQKIKNKVKSAMTYPVVVLCMAIAILLFLMIKIVPKFQEIFNDILEGKPLPLITRVVMNVSNFMVGHFVIFFSSSAAFIALVVFLARTEKGRRVVDHLKLNNPIFGTLVRKTAIARFSRTLSTLMDSGVPILQALKIVGETAGNSLVTDAVNVVHDAVKEGENIAPPMEATGVFPPMVISMVEVGEETGDLPAMLGRIATDYEEDVDNAVASITSIIEPVMIVFLAMIVGTIVLAIFLPMVELLKGMQQ